MPNLFPEKWIACIANGDGSTTNIVALSSYQYMLWWLDEHAECKQDGYYYEGHKVYVKRQIVL